MQFETDYLALSLYLLKKVVLTLADGQTVCGTLTSVSVDAQTLTVDGQTYATEAVSDMEMTGNVVYHTYADAPEKACDIDGLYFGLEDFVPGADYSKILYGEFDCFAACHLVFEHAKICAKDVRILSCAHKYCAAALEKMVCMYVLQDETVLVGTLQEGEETCIQTLSGAVVPIAFEAVEDILRLPMLNECVEITLKNGNVCVGTVSAASDTVIVLIDEAVQALSLTDVKTIRYTGKVQVGAMQLQTGTAKRISILLGDTEAAFLCKKPYFRTPEIEQLAMEGAQASFIPGVTDRGLIAKDIFIEAQEIAPGDEEERTGIIVIVPTAYRTTGYIGNAFVTKTYSTYTHSGIPAGEVTFGIEQLDFHVDPHNIYVVRYSCNPNALPLKARNIELIESYPVADFAKVWIDEDGAVRKLPVSVLYLDKFINQTIDVELTDGGRISGTLTDKNELEICLACEDGNLTVNMEEVSRVFYRGIVTAYQSNNGTGFIGGQHWFHVNNFTDMDQILHLQVGAAVQYTFEVSRKGNMCAATCITLTENEEKKGYVLKHIIKAQGKGYGFITPAEFLEERLQNNDKSGKLYYKEAEVENPGGLEINTNKYYYSVSYVEGENNTAYNVRFLEQYTYDTEAAPEPVAEPAPVKTYTETYAISEIAQPSEALEGQAYEYGLINIFSSHYALINPQYYNRSMTPEGEYDLGQSTYFNPDDVTITPDPRLKTGKYAYLVRYVKKGTMLHPTTGVEQGMLDTDYPIEVVHSFSKKQCASIMIDDATVTVEYVEGVKPDTTAVQTVSEDYDDAPEFAAGESVYLELKDTTVYHGIYSGENEESYLYADGKSVNKEDIGKLYRFGVITDLNIQDNTATINNHFDFNLRVAETKMVSILKNQKNLVRLHVMYTCMEGKITEVCRVSKRCLTNLIWDNGVVTEMDSKAHNIMIDANITHYLTVMSDGINAYVNNGSILNREVFVKQVCHPFLSSGELEPELVAMALDVRCQEEELKIQYDEGKDVYFGYRNATISFPVFGSAKYLHERIGETIPVCFRVSADMMSLEGYCAEDAEDDASEITEAIEEDNSAGILRESLSLLLLQKDGAEQLLTSRVNADEIGSLSDVSQAQRTVDLLLSQSKRLAAVRVALDYPDGELAANKDSLLRTEIKSRCTGIGLDANAYYGEHAFYLSALLRYPASTKSKAKNGRVTDNRYSRYDCLYRLFLQDFESRERLVNYIQAERPATRANLIGLLGKNCMDESELVAHVLLLDKLSFDIVSPIIRNNFLLADAVRSHAKKIDDTISNDDIIEVLRALQERYLHDKRRFTDRVQALIGTTSVCDKLQEILTHMQSRFLRLVCADDRLRFERLLKICTDVVDYINKPDFSQQEQILQTAYREISLLEEEIQSHPCKESAEILLCAEDIDLSSNIMTTVKAEIYTLLNGLYQAASRPSIQCKVNEITLHPNAKSFWLIVANGSEKESLQTAENLQIELESFTLGFMPQKQLRLPSTRLSCGEQLAVEVEFELDSDVTGALEFGWTASFEHITAFAGSGQSTKKTFLQESEQPLQLQMNAVSEHVKNYQAENPYYISASGQALTTKEMFFGREKEKGLMLDAICTQNGEKQFIPGSAVIIHGQKKSGKTSLVHQIKNYIKEDPDLSNKAIMIDFSNILSQMGGVEQLGCFQRTFYATIMSRFGHEIKRYHPDVVQMLKEAGIKIPKLEFSDYRDTWPVAFDAFFREFASVDNGRHSVILYMDEFTMLCTTILSEVKLHPEKASLNNIPNFIKTFSQYGFIQVIIGHEAMMRALDTLGVLNHTAEFATTIEIAALDEEASRALVVQPMAEKFGYDVYGSELGKQAIDSLLDLSGRSPLYLTRLCNEMFMYYTNPEKCPSTQLVLGDVQEMVEAYADKLLPSDFDILLREDGDDAEEAEKRITYQYLHCAALLSLASYDKRTADSAEISLELIRKFNHSKEKIEMTRNVLEARRVITVTNGGRVKINTGLFSKWIQQKYGR